MRIVRFILAAFLLCGTLLQGGTTWPQFRGPHGDGRADARALPLVWSEQTNIVWKVAPLGRGRSSPVVATGRVWLTTAVEKGVKRTRIAADDMQTAEHVSLFALCLDAATGKPLWRTLLFAVDQPDPVHWLNSWATPSPVIEGGRLYCDFGTFGTACLESTTGAVVWKRRLPLDHQVGPGSSPVVFRDLLILVRDGRDAQYVTALDKHTGQPVWRTDRPPIETRSSNLKKSFSTPLLISVDGEPQLISVGAHWAVAYRPATGAEVWRVKHGRGFSIGACPAYAAGLVFIGTGCMRASLLAIDVAGRGDVTSTHVRWRTPRQVPIMSSPVVAGREIYWVSDKGIACCADAATGKIHWQERLGEAHLASPLAAEGRIYFFGRKGLTTVIQAGPELKKLAVNRIEGALSATPALVDGAIYLRTDAHLYRIGKGAPSPGQPAGRPRP